MDGAVARLGRRIDPASAVVTVDGVVIGLAADLVHYLLNKPAGVVTTAADPQGRPIVTDLVPDDPRVFPVGRLDADTEGLLVLTNDGDLAHRLTHPSFGVPKEYLAHVEGQPSRAAVRVLRAGVDLDDRAHRPGQGGRGRAGPAADRDPRRPQPPGPAHVRGGGPPGAAAGEDPHRPDRGRVPAAGPVAAARAARGQSAGSGPPPARPLLPRAADRPFAH